MCGIEELKIMFGIDLTTFVQHFMERRSTTKRSFSDKNDKYLLFNWILGKFRLPWLRLGHGNKCDDDLCLNFFCYNVAGLVGKLYDYSFISLVNSFNIICLLEKFTEGEGSIKNIFSEYKNHTHYQGFFNRVGIWWCCSGVQMR